MCVYILCNYIYIYVLSVYIYIYTKCVYICIYIYYSKCLHRLFYCDLYLTIHYGLNLCK